MSGKDESGISDGSKLEILITSYGLLQYNIGLQTNIVLALLHEAFDPNLRIVINTNNLLLEL